MPSPSATSLHSTNRCKYADNFEEVQNRMQMELNQTTNTERPSQKRKERKART